MAFVARRDRQRTRGYSVMRADSLDAAVAKGCPVLAGGANVLVSETIPAT